MYFSSHKSAALCADACVVNNSIRMKEEVTRVEPVAEKRRETSLTLDASKLGDFPARYVICSLKEYQFPIVGVYCDPRVISGFKYRVRPLPKIGEDSTKHKCLFNNRALTLRSIGRGYARRFTFEADKNKLNDNDNYFWSDNRPEGFAFEIEAVTEGDKFTIFDLNNEAQGTLEILNTEGNQIEISNNVTGKGIEKRIQVKFIGKVEFYETGVAKPIPLSGTAMYVKAKGKSMAEIAKITNVLIKNRKYILRPGVDTTKRRVTVRGSDIKDIPTKYTMTGLKSYEIPVVGTYVDPRIIPGFYYRVRPNDRKSHLFNGKTLKLMSIGMGYAKRLTFESESKIENDNYLWSDNHPDGLGLEPRAVHEGMKFKVTAGGHVLGEATVFRTDNPQIEEKMEKIPTKDGKFAIQKYIHVDVICHVRLTTPGRCSTDSEQYLMRVCGLAVVRKEPNSINSRVLRVEKIGVDSELEILFRQSNYELIFLP
ncbi:uncharacterized protein LOC123310012 isoform X2 [Coccinella septempunctata]|uniref:uncharacterized protein LOC123310012 isoform X2 n=1 Tax=Coccinella septempunctata TaxID=41139 RepID=UPI001D0962C7|nr:uncharacterized protein LOC123310012 isoform X2 [Coccinella septempunctata]